MKTSIYLPDDLAEQVRAHGISISEVAQAALRRAIRTARAREQIVTDIERVAERLRGTVVTAERERMQEGRAYGAMWARDFATARELEDLTTGKIDPVDLDLSSFYRSVDAPKTAPFANPDSDPFYDGFMAAAGEVWEAVMNLL